MPRRTPLILVVDDDDMILEVIREGLELDGYAVDIASSGAEALELCGARTFDLAIVKLERRGDMSGTAVAEALAKRGLPVILTSGTLEGESELRALVEETLAKAASHRVSYH